MNTFEFENNYGTRLNIQMTRPDQDISQINPESQINLFNPDSRINLDSQINYLIRINSPIRPTFNTPLTWPTENTPLTRPTETNHQNIQMTRPDQDISGVNPGSRINPESQINPENQFNPDSQINFESRINCPIRINSLLWPTFNIPLTRSAGWRVSRQRDNFYVAYDFYEDPNLHASGWIST